MKDGLYWLVSERSSMKVVAECQKDMWYLIGERDPVTEEEINRRGWTVGKRLKRKSK